MPICPACDSTNTEADSFMGQLGNLKHYRCRYCGMDYSKRVPRRRKPVKQRRRNPAKGTCPLCGSTKTKLVGRYTRPGIHEHTEPEYHCANCDIEFATPFSEMAVGSFGGKKTVKKRRKNPCRHRRNPSTGMMLFLAAAGVGAYFLYRNAQEKSAEAAELAALKQTSTKDTLDTARERTADATTTDTSSTVEEVLNTAADKNTAVSGFGLHGYFRELPGHRGMSTSANTFNRRG